MEDPTVRIGLLLEAAESHQASATQALQALLAHTAGLDHVVREEIRATMVEELQDLRAQSQQAAAGLRTLARRANCRLGLLAAALVLCASTGPLALSWWLLPRPAEVAALRATHERLVTDIARLRDEGAAADLRHCGEQRRLCVRVDREAPRYGAAADYLVLKGY